jgi:hypothetical protein
MSEQRKHSEIEYKGYSVCPRCDVILCPANRDKACMGTPIADAMAYIDGLTGGPAKRDDELTRLKDERDQLRTELGKAKDDMFLVKVACMSVLDPHATATSLNAGEVKRRMENAIARIDEVLGKEKGE